METSRWKVAIALLGVAVLSVGCGASGESVEDDVVPDATEEVAGGSDGSFGSLDELCGAGDVSVGDDEQGIANGQLNIGVATDRDAEVRPGLNKELWDTSVAFADWCNDQGGIGGLQIHLVELSGALFNVEAAMTTACNDVFAMVGGAFAQDQLEFSGNAASDFHQCGMIDIPAFAASAAKSGSNGVVQPIPVAPDAEINTGFKAFKELFPDQAESAVIVYGDLAVMEGSRDKFRVALDDAGIDVVDTVNYPVVGVTDWTPFARKVLDSGATMLTFIGEPTNLANLLARLDEQGWEGTPVLQSNMYDEQIFGAGTAGPDGAVLRTPAHPFEEADEWPAVQQYLDLLAERVPDARTSLIGLQSLSAWLLFTVAANECSAANDGVLDRTCILERAAAQEDWTGGGLHAPQQLAPNVDAVLSPCIVLLVVRDGAFERLHPDVEGTGAADDGFDCRSDGVSRIEGIDAGEVDPDRAI